VIVGIGDRRKISSNERDRESYHRDKEGMSIGSRGKRERVSVTPQNK
jgi:hypothetical protein